MLFLNGTFLYQTFFLDETFIYQMFFLNETFIYQMFFLNETLIGYYNYNFFLSGINWRSFTTQETTIYNSSFLYDPIYLSLIFDELHSFSQYLLGSIITLQFSPVNVVLLFESLLCFQVDTNMKDAILVAFKFLLCVSLLIFARGGIPRFRFDYLTKLGWIRFLSIVLLFFLLELLILSAF